MKKIIVFYDSCDLKIARRVANEINAAGFVSWLAEDDSKTDWHTEVDDLIVSDGCAGAVAIWSQTSKENSVVRDESKEIIKIQKPLIGILLTGIEKAPYGLRDGPRHRLESGAENIDDGKLSQKIISVFGGNNTQNRALNIGGKSLTAPNMILSVSSFETQIDPNATLSLLSQVAPPAVLVSAYDLLRPKKSSKRSTIKAKITNTDSIDKLRDSGTMIFLDSGNYEAMRYKDQNWKLGKKHLLEAQDLVGVDLAFTHDSFPKVTTHDNVDPERRVNEIANEYQRDQTLINCAVAPIVHAPRLSGSRYRYDLLPAICCGVVKAVEPPMIAVAERELGDGIMERVRTIAKIRKALNDQGSATLLHVLGTGNPLTMAFLAMAGADFFDGLEWCRTAIDGYRWRLYHFQQWDIFASQHGLIQSPEIAQIVKDPSGSVPWITKVALHNMAFFIQASQAIQEHHQNGEYEQLFAFKELANEYQIARKIIEECQ